MANAPRIIFSRASTFSHILWTALSVALGLELRGEYIRGVPCIKKNQQLYCPRAGNSYPLDRIELFIDENKALMRRMYGEFDMPDYGGRSGSTKKKRSTKPGVPDLHFDPGPDPLKTTEEFGKNRSPRQNFRSNQSSESGRLDACESKIEIVTPYWASNSAGKIRAIVNTQHFEQAIHQEVCSKSSTKRCSGGLWLRAEIQVASTAGLRPGQRLQRHLYGLVSVSLVLRLQV
ncbi:hypothetical protein NQ315_000350 [Exocentrus adspersus]|uniref:Spaetzle domain-containing protein n=1 Tax=Exocentrus adspersus TaxID=1586481 RepID=A0AAV8VLK4_9CUCU|nr:hypothetical protein NQ315_000350 [Exocentrus adspersus]